MSPSILLLGATGATGHELGVQALEQGHDVTALVRDPARLRLEGEHVHVVIGSAVDADAVERAISDQDAVLCCLGTRSPTSLVRSDLMRASMNALVPAMQRRGVSRLILLSALGVGRSAGHAPRALRIAFATFLRQVGRDKAAAEDYVARAGDVDWTIVYPPALTDGPRTGAYRAGETLALRGVPKISRADVADFMLAQVARPDHSRRIAIVGPS